MTGEKLRRDERERERAQAPNWATVARQPLFFNELLFFNCCLGEIRIIMRNFRITKNEYMNNEYDVFKIESGCIKSESICFSPDDPNGSSYF